MLVQFTISLAPTCLTQSKKASYDDARFPLEESVEETIYGLARQTLRRSGALGDFSCRVWRLERNKRRQEPPASSSPARPLVFVGFDASEPLVDAMRQGKIHGLVVQNPLRMGKLSVMTMVKHLEKQPIEKQISTGETLVTPENMNDPDIAPLIHPPQVRQHERLEPLGEASPRSTG